METKAQRLTSADDGRTFAGLCKCTSSVTAADPLVQLELRDLS